MSRLRLMLPLFLVSAAAVGYEIALTRYFAVAKWSEYGYWVISIVMVGFALSGVVLALARDALARRAALLLRLLPALLIVAAAVGYHLTTTNPFNPLQLQNQATFAPEIVHIAGYYAALLPFFFLAGLFVSLSFVSNGDRLGEVYAFDLTGAGIGSLAVLLLMYVAHPFELVPVLLVPLALAGMLPGGKGRWMAGAATVLCLAGSWALLQFDDQAAYNDFKAIYAPLHVPDSRTVVEVRAPTGLYALLDDFTERVDTDVSNDAGMLGLAGPPLSFGLYRDGNRIAALPRPGQTATAYAPAALDVLPYTLRPQPQVLLVGASGGFRVQEALTLGAAHVTALESEPVLYRALRRGLGPSPAVAPDPRVTLSPRGPVAAARALAAPVDVIDISADYLDAGEANAHGFTVEALKTYLSALRPGGIVSIPVSIREFPAYAVRVLATVRAALLDAGITDPTANVVVYRSAWNVRILVSNRPFDAAAIATIKKFCDDRSFDVSYYPGIDVAAARANIYNDLPAVSFEAGEVTSGGGPDDAVADEAQAVLEGNTTPSQAAFNLAPITDARPFFYDVLRLERIGTILKRIEVLPQAELGPLVNLAVLAQAIVIAALVLMVPLAGRRMTDRVVGGAAFVGRVIVYFATLGLGFLFIEITLIDKVAFYLNDKTTAFALVLTAMLIFGGIGAAFSGRFAHRPRRTIGVASLLVIAWCLLLMVGLQDAMLATINLAVPVKILLVVAVLAPVSLALGLPFPLGLAQTGSGPMLPWAWALNGAFSVVATPLANLIALESGFDRVLLCAAILYGLSTVSFPAPRKSLSWQNMSATRRDAA